MSVVLAPVVRKITLVVRGDTDTDYEDALAQATALLRQGNLAGADRSETSGFYFDSTEDVPEQEHPAS